MSYKQRGLQREGAFVGDVLEARAHSTQGQGPPPCFLLLLLHVGNADTPAGELGESAPESLTHG